MKDRIILLLGFVLLAVFGVGATAFQKFILLPPVTGIPYSVSASSSTATLWRPGVSGSTIRCGWTLKDPSASYVVYWSTFPITAAGIVAGGHYTTIQPKGADWQDLYAYQGPIYVLTEAGQSAITVTGEERLR